MNVDGLSNCKILKLFRILKRINKGAGEVHRNFHDLAPSGTLIGIAANAHYSLHSLSSNAYIHGEYLH